MSFFTDLRDTITAPIRAISNFASDVVQGQNIGNSSGKFFGEAFSAKLGGTALIVQNDKAQSVLKSLSPYTIGVSGDIADVGKTSYDLNTGRQDPTRSVIGQEFRQTFRSSAIVGGSIAAAGALAGSSAALQTTVGTTGYGIASSVYSGKGVGSSLLSAANSFVPESVKDAVDTAKDIAGGIFGKNGSSTPSNAGNSNSSSPGYAESSQVTAGVSPLLLIGAGLAAFFILKRLRK